MSFPIVPVIYRQVIFIMALALCITPWIDPPIALLLGFIIAQTTGNPFVQLNHKATQVLLKISVIGLGFGMNVSHALQAGKEGFWFTIASIIITLVAGLLLGKLLRLDKKISYLISGGTAICGGSAIAAISPMVNANEKQISVALGCIFILNSIALLLFPLLGHLLTMDEHQFGLWCAIAIHDTSSVVGAASKFGEESLRIATTVKLERALWIIPLTILTGIIFRESGEKIKLPFFIGFFILAMCVSTYFPDHQEIYSNLVLIAKKGLTLTLFLIGSGLSMKALKSVGIKPLILGVLLWILISVTSLMVIMMM